MIQRYLTSLLLALFLASTPLLSQELPPLIPKPEKISMGKGSFMLDAATAFVVAEHSPQLSELAAMASEGVRSIAGLLR